MKQAIEKEKEKEKKKKSRETKRNKQGSKHGDDQSFHYLIIIIRASFIIIHTNTLIYFSRSFRSAHNNTHILVSFEFDVVNVNTSKTIDLSLLNNFIYSSSSFLFFLYC